MPCSSEEECRRQKIIRDSAVVKVAARGIEMAQRGELTLDQMQALIEVDERYLAEAGGVSPELTR